MEKYTDSTAPQPDSEDSSFLPTTYPKPETQRRRSLIYLTLFNLFLFTLSMLSLICAVMSQKDTSGHSAAKLMDEFDIFCTLPWEYLDRLDTKLTIPSPSNAHSRILTAEIRTPQPPKLIKIRRNNRRCRKRLDGRRIPFVFPCNHPPSSPHIN
jgi:hypothetical protein